MRTRRKIGGPKRRGRSRPAPSSARVPWKQLEQELKLFRTAADASPDLVYLVDPVEMKYLYVNETACRMSGFTRAEYMKLSPAYVAMQKPEDLKRIYEEVMEKRGEGLTT